VRKFLFCVTLLFATPAVAQVQYPPAIPKVAIGAPNGVAGLDANGAAAATVNTISVTGGALALAAPQFVPYGTIKLTGALTSAETIAVPAGVNWRGTIVNLTTGAFTVSVGVVGQATPLAIQQGATRNVASDGTNLYSAVAEAQAVSSPTVTTTADLACWGGISGASLTDCGAPIGTQGHVVPTLDGANTYSGFQTFNGGTNLAASVGSMIINGDMDIDQLLEGGLNGSGIDRWAYTYTTGSGLSLQRVVDAPVGYGHSLKMVASATPVTPAAGDIRYVRTSLEGSQAAALAWGTTNGQAAVLSFQAKASIPGTYAVVIRNSIGTESYIATYTVTTASVWQQFSLTIPAAPVGSPWSAFIAGNFVLSVGFDLGTGSTFATANVNQWQNSNFITATGATSLVANASATLQITAVHLIAGTNAGGYTPRPYAQELNLAQRYLLKTFPEGITPAQNAGKASALCARAPAAASYVSAYLRAPNGFYAGTGSTVTLTLYNPSAANANWRDITASADVAAIGDPATAKGGAGAEIATSATVATAGDDLCIHAVLNSGFN
jgi:hypothetical protein